MRDRQADRDRDRHRQTDRHTETQRQRQRDRDRERDRETETDRQRQRERETERKTQRDRERERERESQLKAFFSEKGMSHQFVRPNEAWTLPLLLPESIVKGGPHLGAASTMEMTSSPTRDGGVSAGRAGPDRQLMRV